VETCRRLSSSDPDELFRAVEKYSAVHDTLLTMTRHG
jgi:N6-adenosine-specific RNA methylase IME4